MLTTLHQKVRVAEGREAVPSAGSVDSQTVKTTEMGGHRCFHGKSKHALMSASVFSEFGNRRTVNVNQNQGGSV